MIVSSYSFIDASTGDYQEEEVFYQEEEQENFDHITNQGKLLPMQARLMQTILVASYILANCKALQEKGTITFYFMNLSQVFTLQALLDFIYQSYFLIYDSLGLVIE